LLLRQAYFEKKNSLKELYRAVVQRRPILAVLEPDESQDGGLDVAAVEALLTNSKLDKFKLRKKWAEWKEEDELLPGAFDHAPGEADVRALLFATSPVEWNRLPHFRAAEALELPMLAAALRLLPLRAPRFDPVGRGRHHPADR
jgi:hypothetical protein